MRNECDEIALGIRGRNTEDEARTHLRSKSEVDDPDFGRGWGVSPYAFRVLEVAEHDVRGLKQLLVLRRIVSGHRQATEKLTHDDSLLRFGEGFELCQQPASESSRSGHGLRI